MKKGALHNDNYYEALPPIIFSPYAPLTFFL